MKMRFKTVFCLFALTLSGCPLWEGNSQVVSVGPVNCSLTSDSDGSIDPTRFNCQVTVAGTNASKSEIQTSITSVLEEDILPYICPVFTRAEIHADTKAFSKEIQAELSDAYDGSGWQIKAAHCDVSE